MASTFNPKSVEDLSSVTKEYFDSKVRDNAEPVVMRGAVSHWPVVSDALSAGGAKQVFKRLSKYDTQKQQGTLIGKPGVKGEFHYGDNLKTLNYTTVPETMSAALSRLLTAPSPDGTYIQSIPAQHHFPAFMDEHTTELVPAGVTPRAWIGTPTTVQTHFDTQENIACVVLGEREITLFPPQELPGLYPGPLETAPGGVFVSLTSLENPDFEAHPKFEQTLKTARRTRLYPGDAIYIPYGWWHHIKATAPLNMLINYWWTDEKAMIGNPHAAMFHAMMCFQHLSPTQAKTWENMFSHFVFKQHGDPMAHVVDDAKGILGGIRPEDKQRAIYTMIQSLGAHIGLRPPQK